MSLMFDTHEYVKELKAAGMPEEQAEVQAKALVNLVSAQVVTKEYLDAKLSEAKMELIKWVIGLFGIQIAVITFLFKILK